MNTPPASDSSCVRIHFAPHLFHFICRTPGHLIRRLQLHNISVPQHTRSSRQRVTQRSRRKHQPAVEVRGYGSHRRPSNTCFLVLLRIILPHVCLLKQLSANCRRFRSRPPALGLRERFPPEFGGVEPFAALAEKRALNCRHIGLHRSRGQGQGQHAAARCRHRRRSTLPA